jgi:hypothetical protein
MQIFSIKYTAANQLTRFLISVVVGCGVMPVNVVGLQQMMADIVTATLFIRKRGIPHFLQY